MAFFAANPRHARSSSAKFQIFDCGKDHYFTVSFSDDWAIIALPRRHVEMKLKKFPLGERYVSDEGTLIIDGDFATLVLNDELNFQNCRIKRGPAALEQLGRY